MNVVITSLESMYNYSTVPLISMNLCKSLLCPCKLYIYSNKNIAKIIPAARLNPWHTRTRQTIRCDVGTFFDACWTALFSRWPWFHSSRVMLGGSVVSTLMQKWAVFPAFSSREVTLGQMRKNGIHFIIYPFSDSHVEHATLVRIDNTHTQWCFFDWVQQCARDILMLIWTMEKVSEIWND